MYCSEKLSSSIWVTQLEINIVRILTRIFLSLRPISDWESFTKMHRDTESHILVVYSRKRCVHIFVGD